MRHRPYKPYEAREGQPIGFLGHNVLQAIPSSWKESFLYHGNLYALVEV